MLCQKGFLISYVKFGDEDAVLHFFTKDKGFQSFFQKKLFSKKNREKAYLLPLNELSLTLYPPSKYGGLTKVKHIEPVEKLENYQDFKTNAVLFFVADFLRQILLNEIQNTVIYEEISIFKNNLQQKKYTSHYIFLFQILKNLGISPLVSAEDFLNPENGIFSSKSTSRLFDEELSNLWKKIIESEEPYSENIPTSLRKNLLESCMLYYQHHLSGFSRPASLEIIYQIF